MKKSPLIYLFALVLIFFSSYKSMAQNPPNWTDKQLIEPSELAKILNTKENVPVIISVGPGAVIPNSINAGMASTPEGRKELKHQLKNMDKDSKVVIYCGCCPFEHCPNVRPAINLLKEMKFTNYFLLDLPHNIKKDWIDQGYPVVKE